MEDDGLWRSFAFWDQTYSTTNAKGVKEIAKSVSIPLLMAAGLSQTGEIISLFF